MGVDFVRQVLRAVGDDDVAGRGIVLIRDRLLIVDQRTCNMTVAVASTGIGIAEGGDS